MNSAIAASSRRLFVAVDAVELAAVARTVASAERLGVLRVAKVLTRLGNGWLYPLLSAALVTAVEAPLRFAATSALSVLLAFSVYPVLKRFLSRRRPCDYDRSLVCDGLEPLDRYSCPSGHAMTAAAYAVPLLFAWPAAAPLVVALCAAMSWSRVALGHHYPSDVLLGTALGSAVAVTVSSFAY